jgi:hypothetical protein
MNGNQNADAAAAIVKEAADRVCQEQSVPAVRPIAANGE